MYNFLSMKLSIAALLTISLSGFLMAAPDELDDSYAKLKAAVEKKDPDEVKTAAADTLRERLTGVVQIQPGTAAISHV